jgi:RNA polymerase sigma-70 factor (ECF subfamily)
VSWGDVCHDLAGLIAEALREDKDAIEELLERAERHLRPAVGWVLWRNFASDVDDVMQKARLRIWERLAELGTPDGFPAWVRTIGRNLALDHLRSRSREPTLLEFERAFGASDPNASPEDHCLRIQLLAHLLAGLPEAQCETLLLREVEGLSYEEIAGVRGVSPNTVGPTLAAARRSAARRMLACETSP